MYLFGCLLDASEFSCCDEADQLTYHFCTAFLFKECFVCAESGRLLPACPTIADCCEAIVLYCNLDGGVGSNTLFVNGFMRIRYCNVEVSSSADKAIVCDAHSPGISKLLCAAVVCDMCVCVCLAGSLPWDLMLALCVWRQACEYVFGSL